MPKVSVIIPVYNVEKYLKRCLDSIVNQTLEDIEIICVNDCSPDNSAVILEEYAKRDDRIILINREFNGGLSAARNTGLRIARGEYIYFIDSDDWVADNYLEKMYDAITKNNQKAVCCTNVLSVTEDGEEAKLLKRSFSEGIYSYYHACQMAWSWLLEKNFLDQFNVVFPEGLKYEDAYFFHVVIRSLENVYIINDTQYYHFENKNSIMGQSKNRVINNFDIIKVIELIYKEYKDSNKIKIWSIPFFYFPKYFLSIHENKNEYFNQLKSFYETIKIDVLENQKLYSNIELTFLKDIISSENYIQYKMKSSDSIVDALRKNIEKNGTVNGKI